MMLKCCLLSLSTRRLMHLAEKTCVRYVSGMNHSAVGCEVSVSEPPVHRK